MFFCQTIGTVRLQMTPISVYYVKDSLSENM